MKVLSLPCTGLLTVLCFSRGENTQEADKLINKN